MKALFSFPLAIYLAGGLACLCIMIIVDYLLGAEAEHLNAWAIINHWLGYSAGLPGSLAIRKLGLWGATLLMLILNTTFGILLILLLKGLIRIIQSF